MCSLQLDSAKSKLCCKAVFSMATLQTLELNNVILDEAFFTVMSKQAPGSKVNYSNQFVVLNQTHTDSDVFMLVDLYMRLSKVSVLFLYFGSLLFVLCFVHYML